MNRLLTLIAKGFTAYARGSAEIWDSMFGGIDRTLTSWACRPAQAVRPTDPEIDDDESFPLMDEQQRSEDPIMEMYLLGLLDHHSTSDTTATDLFDDSTSAFDNESMFCNSLDMFSDTTCMFDDSSTGGCE
ncbi:MAG: hypothetical protein K8I04_05530 [Gammaproteobacteria bacterium]|nr:hypothetical protein [Gammaproteobacteria bacterium]